jgi:predicted Zn finger-like uncharacterized protein
LYTRCPNCLTVFAVAAEQLKAAHGTVRCGTCLGSFDAIPQLSDGSVQVRSVAPADSQDPGSDSKIAIPMEVGDGHHDDEHDDARIASARLSSTLDAVRVVASVNDAGAQALESGAPLPQVLRVDAEELAERSATRRRTIGYSSAAVALLVLLAGQYVFFMPEDAARRYPQWRGAIESVCVRIGCVLPERRDPARIRVVNRDVRVHPRYEGAMQIKATLTNSAPYRQPYPKVRFTLFNVNGQTIATRVFQPPEYLGRPVDAGARLRPKTRFQVELDVLAPEEAAVSFEFSFL